MLTYVQGHSREHRSLAVGDGQITDLDLGPSLIYHFFLLRKYMRNEIESMFMASTIEIKTRATP